MPKLLSVSDFAKLMGISTQAVYARIGRGTLKTKTVKVEALRVIVPKDVKSE